MKKTCFLLALLVCISRLQAQFYYYNNRFYDEPLSVELMASGAAMNCLTDLGKKEGRTLFPGQINWQNTRPGFSIGGRAIYNDKLGCRLTFSFGTLTASDSLNAGKNSSSARYARNLQFETTIKEVMLLAELYPLTWLAAGQHPVYWMTPYLVAGIAFFNFNPTAKLSGVPVRLQPLRTEGQGFPEYPGRKPYALNQFNLPFGFGFKHEISALVICGLELLYRKLFTDYLDDVSHNYINPADFYRNLSAGQAKLAATLANRQRESIPQLYVGTRRGNPLRKDAYLSINLKLAVNLNRQKR